MLGTRFRRINPAASLKRVLRDQDRSRLRGFRRINPAASLKPYGDRGFRPLVAMFPPDKSGGLIEASGTINGSLGIGVTFPPDKSGGLIEARSRGT